MMPTFSDLFRIHLIYVNLSDLFAMNCSAESQMNVRVPYAQVPAVHHRERARRYIRSACSD